MGAIMSTEPSDMQLLKTLQSVVSTLIWLLRLASTTGLLKLLEPLITQAWTHLALLLTALAN